MAEITNIGQVRRSRARRKAEDDREDRLLHAIDELVHAFWDEGVRVSNVKITWTGGESYDREARGKAR